MKTASFFSYTGEGRISIARFAPRTLTAGYRVYRPLAPGSWFNSVPYAEYLDLYTKQLVKLDAKAAWDELHALVAPHEPVLLCWERPPLTSTNWCHRTMVANWFERHLGHKLTEVAKEAGRGNRP